MNTLPKEITECLEASNSNLIYLLDLLTPMEGYYRTPQEQVYFELALSAARNLPVNNNAELQKYF